MLSRWKIAKNSRVKERKNRKRAMSCHFVFKFVKTVVSGQNGLFFLVCVVEPEEHVKCSWIFSVLILKSREKAEVSVFSERSKKVKKFEVCQFLGSIANWNVEFWSKRLQDLRAKLWSPRIESEPGVLVHLLFSTDFRCWLSLFEN